MKPNESNVLIIADRRVLSPFNAPAIFHRVPPLFKLDCYCSADFSCNVCLFYSRCLAQRRDGRYKYTPIRFISAINSRLTSPLLSRSVRPCRPPTLLCVRKVNMSRLVFRCINVCRCALSNWILYVRAIMIPPCPVAFVFAHCIRICATCMLNKFKDLILFAECRDKNIAVLLYFIEVYVHNKSPFRFTTTNICSTTIYYLIAELLLQFKSYYTCSSVIKVALI